MAVLALAACGGSSDSQLDVDSLIESAVADLPSGPAADASALASELTEGVTADDDAASADAELMDMDMVALTDALAQAAGVEPSDLVVECPSDSYPNQVGHVFECGLIDMSSNGKEFTLTITVTDTVGNVDFEITAEGWPTGVPRP